MANAYNDTYSVTVYAALANGNVAPIRTIAGRSTQLSYPTGIAVDGSGHIYVANPGTQHRNRLHRERKRQRRADQYHQRPEYRAEWTEWNRHSLNPKIGDVPKASKGGSH